jgi:nucleoside-diphosphate-sugar epimerase
VKVLITGAAGFIGSHMMRSFRDAGYEVAGIDLAAKEGVLNVDITDYQSLERMIVREKPEAIVHLAAISPPGRLPDVTRARLELGWTPTVSLDEGLKRTYEWMEKDLREDAISHSSRRPRSQDMIG